MRVISHRGNLTGRNPDRENHPHFVMGAIDSGFDTEIDVWCDGKTIFLGHDMPQYPVKESFLLHPNLWCHAKNQEAFVVMSKIGSHYFWHENDRFTITSRGRVWCFPNNYHPEGVTVIHGDKYPKHLVWGVCTDYPLTIKHNLIHSSQ